MTEFASGITQVFYQASAPTGWTKVTTFNQAMLRLTSGNVGSGGDSDFTTILDNRTTNSTSLTTSQIGSHTHSYPGKQDRNDNTDNNSSCAGAASFNIRSTFNAANSPPLGGSHNHTIDMACKYADVILATVN